MWAYATRRAETVAEAEAILRDAEQRHPRDPTIKFNLGCYACLRGDLTLARTYVERAIELDRSFIAIATDDEDLIALRAVGFAP
jgi:Flp pilus assembly protein TadD